MPEYSLARSGWVLYLWVLPRKLRCVRLGELSNMHNVLGENILNSSRMDKQGEEGFSTVIERREPSVSVKLSY